MSIAENIEKIKKDIGEHKTQLIVVSKTQSIESIEEVLATGHTLFGENQVQELVEKWETFPKNIEWHMIGHLQTNKVKYIAPFIHLIQSVDSLKLLKEINKQGKAHQRVIPCLLQVHIAEEETKYGFLHEELIEMLNGEEWKTLNYIRISGLMAIATNTTREKLIQDEFYEFHSFFQGIKMSYFRKDEAFKELSIGMSSDYKIALLNGSTMIRVGSSIFGKRSTKGIKTEN
jgi:pyridoxal phosphate enzyme (YggS family)